MRTRTVFSIATLFTFLLVACGDSSTGPDSGEASFEITLSGDVSKTFTGEAVWESGTNRQGVSGFGVVAANPAGGLQSLGLLRDGTRPSSGQFNIAEHDGDVASGDFIFVVSYENDAGNQVVLGSRSGTVNIQDSNSSEVSGSFEAQVVGFSAGQPDSIQATADGTFNAISATEFNPSGG